MLCQCGTNLGDLSAWPPVAPVRRLVRFLPVCARAHFGDKVLRTVIPRSVKVSEAPGYGMTILDYDPGSRGAMSYLDASRELAERGTPQ